MKVMEKEDKRDVIISQILKYIDENYTNPMLSTDMVADAVGLSKNYVRNIFKRSRGVSMSDYITAKRFDTVCALLIETDLPAQRIAEQTGFHTKNYFYTAFKKYTGYTINEYRQLFAERRNNR